MLDQTQPKDFDFTVDADRPLQKRIDTWLFRLTRGVVQGGPFAGVRLTDETAWHASTLAPLLIGTFEQELHPAIEQEIARLNTLPEPRIVNVGCAEGYYAVGLACRVPHAQVWGLDIDKQAVRIAKINAATNGVNLIFGADMVEVFAAPDLIVMDCEGAETVYLDPDEFPGLRQATIIVEIHNMREPWPSQIIKERFEASHTIENIFEGSRDPNVFSFLNNKPSAFRWMCVCENRPCTMSWFILRPRG